MACLSVIYLVIRMILFINCESVSSESKEIPAEDQDALYKTESMNDEDLWNLLKQIGRNNVGDPFEGFTNYEDYTLADNIYPTDTPYLSELSTTENSEALTNTEPTIPDIETENKENLDESAGYTEPEINSTTEYDLQDETSTTEGELEENRAVSENNIDGTIETEPNISTPLNNYEFNLVTSSSYTMSESEMTNINTSPATTLPNENFKNRDLTTLQLIPVFSSVTESSAIFEPSVSSIVLNLTSTTTVSSKLFNDSVNANAKESVNKNLGRDVSDKPHSLQTSNISDISLNSLTTSVMNSTSSTTAIEISSTLSNLNIGLPVSSQNSNFSKTIDYNTSTVTEPIVSHNTESEGKLFENIMNTISKNTLNSNTYDNAKRTATQLYIVPTTNKPDDVTTPIIKNLSIEESDNITSLVTTPLNIETKKIYNSESITSSLLKKKEKKVTNDLTTITTTVGDDKIRKLNYSEFRSIEISESTTPFILKSKISKYQSTIPHSFMLTTVSSKHNNTENIKIINGSTKAPSTMSMRNSINENEINNVLESVTTEVTSNKIRETNNLTTTTISTTTISEQVIEKINNFTSSLIKPSSAPTHEVFSDLPVTTESSKVNNATKQMDLKFPDFSSSEIPKSSPSTLANKITSKDKFSSTSHSVSPTTESNTKNSTRRLKENITMNTGSMKIFSTVITEYSTNANIPSTTETKVEEIPLSYNVTTSIIRTISPTISSKIDKETSKTSTFLETTTKKINTPTSKIKTSLDPAKKIFIPLEEEDTVPTFNLKGKSLSTSTLTTPRIYFKEFTTLSTTPYKSKTITIQPETFFENKNNGIKNIIPQNSKKTNDNIEHLVLVNNSNAPTDKKSTSFIFSSTSLPSLQTTRISPKQKSILEPGRKVFLTPENKMVPTSTKSFKYKSIDKVLIPEVKYKNSESTIVKPCKTNSDSLGNSNILHGSRIFMIDEVTQAPTVIERPFFISKSDNNNLNNKKRTRTKSTEDKTSDSVIYSENRNLFKYHKVNGTETNVGQHLFDAQHKQPNKAATAAHKHFMNNGTEKQIDENLKKTKTFDPKRMHIIDEFPVKASQPVTTTTNIKKTAFDINYKFSIDSSDVKIDKPKEEEKIALSKDVHTHKKVISRPVIQIIPNFDVSHISDDQYSHTKKENTNKQLKYQMQLHKSNPQSSIPELMCFEIKNWEKKPMLSCVPLNNTIKSNFGQFFTNIHSGNQLSNYPQKAPLTIRKVLLKNKNNIGTSVIIKTLPKLNDMKFSISGSVFHSKKNSRDPFESRVVLNTPETKTLITNTQVRDVIRHSIIPLKHIANQQSLVFLEEQPNHESYQQRHFPGAEKKIIYSRPKRSTSKDCNMDGVYEEEGSSLAFVFDNTLSMSSELEQMQKTAIQITMELTEKKKNVIRDYVLVTFNDPEVATPLCTNNYNELINALNSITVHGGHDCPEFALTGLKSALQVVRPSSFIFVITDADAKDYYEEENIQPLIMRKTPFIFFLMTERCYHMSHQKGFDVFYSLSEQTNGQIIMMDKADVKEKSLLKKFLGNLTEDYLQKGIAPFTKISSKVAAPVPYSVPVPVELGTKKVTFVISGSKPTLDITDPKGGKPPGNTKEFPKYISVTYTEPISGIWKAKVSSSSGHSFSSYGISTTQINVGFSVLKTNKFSETSHRPLKSAENYVLVEVSNPELVKNISHIDLVNLRGNRLSTIHLTKDSNSNNLFIGGPFIPPDETFNLEMNGFGANGSPLKRISSTAILSQLPEPPYVILPTENSIEEGNTYIIKCHVESLVPITVKVYKKHDSYIAVHNMKQTGDVHFKLKNISLKDQGVYVCWASNVAGINMKEIKITVLVKPPIVSVKDEVLFTTENPALIPCIVSSNHPYTISWKKGTSSRWNNIQNSPEIYSTEKGLIIPDPTSAEEGWYQCTASNIGGDSAGTTYLKLSLPPNIEISGPRRFYKHFNITITCSAISGIPSPEIKWKKNGVDFIENNERVFITYLEKYAKIEILDAVEEDEGRYTCSAVNFAGRDSKDLNLSYEEKPKAAAYVKSCNITHGGNCTLKCLITGRPMPDVIWKKDGITINPSSSNIQILLNHSLLLNDAKLSDNGVYSCAAQSNIGYSEDSIVVQVTGVSPKIIEAPVDTSIEIGENGRLSCIVAGIPQPKIIWKKNYEILNKEIWDENVLEINNATLSDSGVYICAAENILGLVEAQALVNVTGGVLPILNKEKDLEIRKVLIGEKVELQCIVMGGKPMPFKEWYKDGSLLSEQTSTGIKLENGSYFISSVSSLDTGLYECIARNELGHDVKKIQLKFHEPPRIDLSVSSNVVATVGKPAKLICKVTGDPMPKVTWKRHIYSNNKTMRGIHFEDTNELAFDIVTEEDSGRYICQAENIAGVARRAIALSVMVPPKIVSWPIEKFVEAGNIVTLECRSRAIPRPSIQWFKNNITIPKSKYYGQFLRFYAEASDSGTYSCIAENRAGKDIVETNLIVLVPPQIKDGEKVIKAISGSEAVLPCDVSGNPQPSVTWHLNGEVIRMQPGSEPATLRLQNVTEADAGTYTCLAKNKAGANKKKMELVVLTPPKVLPWTEPIKVVTGEYFNVTCQTFANPEARISWFKDRQPLPLDFIRNEKNLEFVVDKNSEGIYTCEARNEAGIDSKDFLLVILDPPVFALHLPYSVDVLHGSDIEIPCVAFGDPQPIMGWNRNDIILQNDIRRIVNSVTGQLTILNADLDDDGYYNCTASNKAGLVWRTVEVNVLELPTAALTVSNKIINEGDEVEFNCNITGKPRPKISWKKDGKILSTENDSKLRLTAHYNDRGNYTCIVKNLAGEDYSTVAIDVSVPPSLTGSNEERIITLKGTSITMNCSSEGIPEPKIIWFFNETQIGETDANLVVNQGILALKNIAIENAGIYSCVVRNIAGSVEKTFTVYVHAKPTITEQMDTKILINKGKDFSIQCSADGIPKPTITWKKGDKNIVSNSYSDVSVAVHNNILLLFNSDDSTEGIYTCIATNIEGQDTKSYEIKVVQADKKKVREGVKEIEVVEGNNVMMNCDSKPGSEIIWLKDTKNLNKMPLERADDVHFLIGDDGKFLNIAEVYLEDTGLYSCIAIHPDGNSTSLFSVNVKFSPYFSDLFPTLEYTVRENKSITLNCPANGNPSPQINWRHAENNLPINAYTLPGVQISSGNGNTLIIKSAQYSHSGLYLCSAINPLGKENRIFNVKVIGPPQRLGSEVSHIEIVLGHRLELNCTIDGSPYPNFKWKYTSEAGEEKPLRYITKSIYIGNVQVEDEGIYTCFASNSVGNSSKTFNVSVIETPRIKRDLNNTIVLAEGEDLKLACKCEGRKLASVKWFFNGFNLNMSNSTIQDFSADFNTTEYTCKLKNVSKETEGSYTCLVSNIAGSDEKKYEVVVIAAPKMLNDDWGKLRKLQFLDGSKIEIKCPVESVDDFKIQWKKNGVLMPQLENQTLYISSSTIDDEAEYICIASNIAGQLASKFQVTVLASPEFLNLHDNTAKKIFLDGKLLLNCSVSANPAPQILWTKNMKQIDNITFPQVIFSENYQILEIDEVDTLDSGKYSCYCSNIAGSTERHFDVEIEVPPMINEENKSLEKIVKTVLYRRVVLRCPLVAKPEPNITWYKDSEEINEGNPLFFISHDKNMLIINHPIESDAGIYKCIGKNDMGNKTFTFLLHITIIMNWSQWSDWSECSTSCGGGRQVRQRECLGERNEILSEFINFQNNSCSGPNIDQRPCNSHTCPINGMWGSWSEWSDCSTNCGEGVIRRTRRCNNPPPAYGGEDCIGETYEDKTCELEPCPINGNWSEWSDWSECHATCGYSLKMRTRRCNNPAPAYGGMFCSGNSRDITVCKKRKCEETYIDWSSWSGWSDCSVTCGIGRQTRKRVCLGIFNKSCIGESRQNKLCRKEPCQRRRLARSAELNILGELNGSPIEETYTAVIEDNNNETEITAVSQNINKTNSTTPYLPFMMSPVSWLAAHECYDGKNGFSVTNGSFHENATYLFATGEEMEMQSDAEIEDPSNLLKMYIHVSGKAPVENKAKIVIDPYEENIVQTDRKTMRSSSKTVLQTNGKSIPVSWRKKIEIPENIHKRIFPVEKLKSKKHRSNYNNNRKRIEYQTAAIVTSKFENDSCPTGFQYDEETQECHDINECVRKWLNKCYQTEICINTIGSYMCECREGYRERPNKGGCKDINECLEGLHMCSHTCQNTKGSYQCLCPYNMILSEDLFNCVEASEEEYDEYSLGIDNIDYFEGRPSYIKRVRPTLKNNNRNRLRNLVHKQDEKNNRKHISRVSQIKTNKTCKPGFKIGKHECEDINECLEDEYACTKEQLCMNTPGSHVCIDAPCPDKFMFSPETRSCLLLCLENEVDCTDGALLSESLQIIVVPVYRANYTFYPFTEILVLSSYDDNNLPLDESIYEIVQNDSGLPVIIRNEKKVGVLYVANYFEVEKRERLILMSSNYDANGDKLHSTMFLIIIYNTNSLNT